MIDKNMKIKNYKTHYIAYIDILGYENLIKRSDETFFKNTYIAINKAIESFKLTVEFLNLIMTKVTIKYKIFSDNIIIFVEHFDDTQIDMINLCSMLYCVKSIQLSLISQAKVFIRGGVCKGKIYADENFIYGLGLIDVVRLEKEADTPRIIVSDAIISDLDRLRFDINIKNNFVDRQLLKEKENFINKINNLVSKNIAGIGRSYFFESMQNILKHCMNFLYNKESDEFWEKDRFVLSLETFFNDIKKNIITQTSDNKKFINYLYLNSFKIIQVQNIKCQKDTFYLQLNIAKENVEYETRLKHKYAWIAEYHNSFCDKLISQYPEVLDLYLSIE